MTAYSASNKVTLTLHYTGMKKDHLYSASQPMANFVNAMQMFGVSTVFIFKRQLECVAV